MSLTDWLPITTRNRVALGLAFAGLLMFVVWNCLPYYEYGEVEPEGIMAMILWPQLLNPENYLNVIRSPDMDGLTIVVASLSIIFGGLTVLLTVPLWQILHASIYVRLPIALLNFCGGAVFIWYCFYIISYPLPYEVITSLLMGLSLLAVSAAYFLFKNELALREERNRPKGE